MLLLCLASSAAAWAGPGDNAADRVENWGATDYTTTLRYDDVYRLTQETKKDSGNNTIYDFGYTYDAVGNRLTRVLGGVTYNFSYDDNNKLTSSTGGGSSASFYYDNNGNMTSVTGAKYGAWTMVYNDSNNLTSLTHGSTDTYAYTSGGQRHSATLNGVTEWYVYNGARLLEEVDDTSSHNMFARYTAAGSATSPHSCMNGSPPAAEPPASPSSTASAPSANW